MESVARSRLFLLWTTFIAGVSLMALEMNASRILSPYFGSSLFVWTSIIGVVLLALSLGYFVGGRVADRFHTSRGLYWILFSIAAWLTFLPLLGTQFLQMTLTFPASQVLVMSLVSTLLLFFVPCTLMGMVSPYVLKLLNHEPKHLGRDAGLQSAVSTFGSLIGTFLPVLLTIPWLGTIRTTLLFAVVLGVTAIVGLRWWWGMLLVLVPVSFFIWGAPYLVNAYTVYASESQYNYLHVYDHGNARYLQIDDPRAVHSVYHPDTVITHNYWDYVALLPFHQTTDSTLILGLAGGSISSLLHHYFPSMQITGVEIDPEVVRLGKEFFAIEFPELTTVTADAREYLLRTKQSYDFVVLDAYHNLSLPVHLATTEFFGLIQSHLTADGTLAINAAHSTSQSDLDAYLAATMAPHFQYIYRLDTNGGYNTILFGRNQPWPASLSVEQQQRIASVPELSHIFSKPLQMIIETDATKIQTDDRNQIEILGSKEVLGS